MQRKASATWQGGLKHGKGSMSTESRVLLLGAAHAEAAAKAKAGCPLSKVLRAEIAMDAKLAA